MIRVIHVSIPHTSRDFFDYLFEGLEPEIGARVWVPFRNQTRLGVVVGAGSSINKELTLKHITQIIDEQALLPEELLALCHWISSYYQAPLSEVLALALPKKYRQGNPYLIPLVEHYQLSLPLDEIHQQLSIKASRQRALIDFIAHHPREPSKAELVSAGFNAALIKILLDSHLIKIQHQIKTPTQHNTVLEPAKLLNDEQASAVDTINKHLTTFQCFMLKGVTGSGKTEVYLQVISQVLAQGRQVLVLVPEIGLTPQLLSRFSARFKEPMVVIHSHLNDTERQLAWGWAREGVAKLIIGTRSAIFTPIPLLGLIVIDEEHDASFKQMEGVRYSARDSALIRAKTANIPIILGTATPSLETLHNCDLKKYTVLTLNHKALTSTPLHYQIIDIRSQALQHGLATSTLACISEHLEKQNQVLVFINRRGFAPILLCHQCGWMANCKACDSHLTVHRRINQVVCHHCGSRQDIPKQCHACHGRELLPIGIGTQRIHEYLSTRYPTTNIVRIDRDEVIKKQALDERLALISRGDAQLIIGTQMLAKGHHFPRLTLVVILDTDNGFYNQDFRALERLGQLLTQVAGRAGRAEFPGQVLIQTHLPQHPLLNTLIQEGYDPFAQILLKMRQQSAMPPYQFLALMRVQGRDQGMLLQCLHAIKEYLHDAQLTLLGPAPAPLARKAHEHRLQLLIKSSSRKKLHHALTQLREWLTINKTYRKLRWNIDIDPMDLS